MEKEFDVQILENDIVVGGSSVGIFYPDTLDINTKKLSPINVKISISNPDDKPTLETSVQEKIQKFHHLSLSYRDEIPRIFVQTHDIMISRYDFMNCYNIKITAIEDPDSTDKGWGRIIRDEITFDCIYYNLEIKDSGIKIHKFEGSYIDPIWF